MARVPMPSGELDLTVIENKPDLLDGLVLSFNASVECTLHLIWKIAKPGLNASNEKRLSSIWVTESIVLQFQESHC